MSRTDTGPGQDRNDPTDRPAIHVGHIGSDDEGLYRWIALGAEELGIPCRASESEGAAPADDATALAHRCALASRLGIGIGLSARGVAIHERHMPARQPVVFTPFESDGDARQSCRAAGANAARLMTGQPLHLDE